MRNFFTRLFGLMFTAALCLPLVTGCGNEEADIEAPVLTLDSLQEQNDNQTGTPTFKIGGGTTLALSGTVEAGAVVEVEVNAGERALADVSGQTWNYFLDSATLEEGSNVIVVSAEDSVGNKRSLNFFVNKDTTGPAITFDQYLTPDQDGIQTIAGTVPVGSTVDVFVEGAFEAPAVVDGSLWHYDLDLSGLGDGVYDVSVIGYDELDNPSSEVIVSIAVESTAPLLSVDQSSLVWTRASSKPLSGTRENGIEPIFTPIETAAMIDNVDVATDPSTWSADFVNLEAGLNLLSIAIDDVSGNPAEAQVIVYRDLTAPKVIGNFPHHGSALDANELPTDLTVTFSEDMAAESLDEIDVTTSESPSMTVVDSAGELVNGEVTYNSATRTATYLPLPDPLVSGQTYTVTVESTVTDALGNALGSDYVWTFRTN